jgi:DNA-directed RNA polymerase subunit RPC12/RpoP
MSSLKNNGKVFFRKTPAMALVKCRECQKLISDKAVSCPSCGAKIKAKTSVFTLLFGGLFCLIVISFVSSSLNNKDATPAYQSTAEQDRHAEETYKAQLNVATAKQLMLGQMKDPDSTKFGTVVSRAGVVCGYVNSKNSYGGYSGETPFIVKLPAKETFLQGKSPGFDKLWNSQCTEKKT